MQMQWWPDLTFCLVPRRLVTRPFFDLNQKHYGNAQSLILCSVFNEDFVQKIIMTMMTTTKRN